LSSDRSPVFNPDQSALEKTEIEETNEQSDEISHRLVYIRQPLKLKDEETNSTKMMESKMDSSPVETKRERAFTPREANFQTMDVQAT
jgi:hypothetical protein